jgi:hypothetical protein
LTPISTSLLKLLDPVAVSSRWTSGGLCQRSAGGAIDASATRAVEFERNSEELDFVHEAIAAALADHQVEVMFGLIGDANLFMANAFVEQYGGRYVSRRRCRARRANMPEYGRCRPSGGYQPELPPRTLPKHALRSPPPRRNDPPVCVAQRLRRIHNTIFSRPSVPFGPSDALLDVC